MRANTWPNDDHDFSSLLCFSWDHLNRQWGIRNKIALYRNDPPMVVAHQCQNHLRTLFVPHYQTRTSNYMTI